MRERPILFSAPMVRAILDGRKTQTRRAVKPQPALAQRLTHSGWCAWHDEAGRPLRNRYGQPGDRLWVRETWHACYMMDTESIACITDCHRDGHRYGRVDHYAADGEKPAAAGKARPSIHMPRWASRITLEVTGVRVERLQDISYEDAIAEGIMDPARVPPFPHTDKESPVEFARRTCHPQRTYAVLWDEINGDGAWHTNPWVWVVEFKRVTP